MTSTVWKSRSIAVAHGSGPSGRKRTAAAKGKVRSLMLKRARSQVKRARTQPTTVTLLDAQLRSVLKERDALLMAAQVRATALEATDRLKDELLATTSHDLKAPLTVIKGYTQLLQRQLKKGPADNALLGQALDTIDNKTNTMIQLVDDLLDAASIQAGVFGLQLAPCELWACLNDALGELAPSERERIDVSQHTSILAGRWDRSKVRRVFNNLLGNALKYSPCAERVAITFEQRESEIEIAIRDQGMGIPADEIPKLFERFRRTPQAQRSGLPGTGLGLFLCRGIVQAHGGRLWAESAGEGQGATFRFTLPLMRSAGGQSSGQQEG